MTKQNRGNGSGGVSPRLLNIYSYGKVALDETLRDSAIDMMHKEMDVYEHPLMIIQRANVTKAREDEGNAYAEWEKSSKDSRGEFKYTPSHPDFGKALQIQNLIARTYAQRHTDSLMTYNLGAMLSYISDGDKHPAELPKNLTEFINRNKNSTIAQLGGTDKNVGFNILKIADFYATERTRYRVARGVTQELFDETGSMLERLAQKKAA
jgi:hypothetical protein